MTIDANGKVTGTFSGDFTGTITGTVDINGNMDAVGSTTVTGMHQEIIWKGKLTVSGTALSAQGTWSGQGNSGTFTGTGTAS